MNFSLNFEMKKRRTPQEKKLLSYEKDCRNTYGERGSHSRHAITLQKAITRRSDRHRANLVLQNVESDLVDSLEQAELKVKAVVPRRAWQKYADSPLGVVVKRKLERREERGMNATTKVLLKDRFAAIDF
ncbi:MAG: hypothetical protein M3O33_20805 [Cyanobacteriota bacterium]|nr:hypothetical protein [Cyanobacteriota bacterium]